MQIIQVINHDSAGLALNAVKIAVASVQIQLDRDYLPICGGAGYQLSLAAHVIPGAWQCLLVANSDLATALGYHELTRDGQPLLKVFIETAKRDRVSWTSILSHEVLETAYDFDLDQFTTIQYQGQACLFPKEIGDPVQADSYKIKGTVVSNFVRPNYWTLGAPPYDFLKKLKKPLPELRPGGYLEYSTPDGKPHQIGAERVGGDHRSRLRALPREQWRRSRA